MHAKKHLRRALCASLLLAASGLTACTGGQENVTPDPMPKPVHCGRLQEATDAGCQPLKTSGVQTQEVMFPSQKTPGGLVSLNGVITRPTFAPGVTPPAKLPGVVLIHGSGPQSRDSTIPGDLAGPFTKPVPVFKDLAEALSAQGFVVLRYDKRTCTAQANPGCGYPIEIARKATWDDLRGDVAAAAAFLGSQKDVDGGDLILMGHSQGSTLALEAAPAVKPSALVLLAGNWSPIDQVIVRQVNWQLNAVKEQLDKKQLDEAQKRVSEIESGLLAIRQGYFPDDEIFMGAPASFWKKWFTSTEATGKMLKAYQGPVLYVRGGDDKNVDQTEQDGFAGALKGRKDSQLVVLPGHTHALNQRGKEGVSPQTTSAILKWLAQ